VFHSAPARAITHSAANASPTAQYKANTPTTLPELV